PGLSVWARLRRHGAERYRRPRRFRPTSTLRCLVLMTVIASILAGLVGAAACWLVLRPALAERPQLRAELDRRALAFRDELARRDAELDVARGQLVDARANAAASAARLATLEEKLPETVRSI